MKTVMLAVGFFIASQFAYAGPALQNARGLMKALDQLSYSTDRYASKLRRNGEYRLARRYLRASDQADLISVKVRSRVVKALRRGTAKRVVKRRFDRIRPEIQKLERLMKMSGKPRQIHLQYRNVRVFRNNLVTALNRRGGGSGSRKIQCTAYVSDGRHKIPYYGVGRTTPIASQRAIRNCQQANRTACDTRACVFI